MLEQCVNAVMDGATTTRFCDEMLDMLYDPAFDHGISLGVSLPVMVPRDWEVSPEITQAVTNADHTACEHMETREFGFHLISYGRAVIKALGASPDAWAQMITQLAYKRLLGKNKRNGATYEAASTRKFYKGRTEIIRVVTNEADAWADSMDEKTSTVEIRSKLFDLTTNKHSNLVRSCVEAQGVVYHLFGQTLFLRDVESKPSLAVP